MDKKSIQFKNSELATLRESLILNNVGKILQETAMQLVMGDGNPDSKIVFIGEAPGKKEDEQGLPFVGSAGKILNQLLDSVNLKRQDVYITNIVKYRPPKNRDPLPAEKQEFWPYLLKELEIIQPEIVVTLGRHAMEYFINDQKISEIHGRLQNTEVGDYKILPLYHPAATIYNRQLRVDLEQDFQQISQLFKKYQFVHVL